MRPLFLLLALASLALRPASGSGASGDAPDARTWTPEEIARVPVTAGPATVPLDEWGSGED